MLRTLHAFLNCSRGFVSTANISDHYKDTQSWENAGGMDKDEEKEAGLRLLGHYTSVTALFLHDSRTASKCEC